MSSGALPLGFLGLFWGDFSCNRGTTDCFMHIQNQSRITFVYMVQVYDIVRVIISLMNAIRAYET